MTIPSLDLPSYVQFCAWIKNGQPRNADDKPILVTRKAANAAAKPAGPPKLRTNQKTLAQIDRQRSLAQVSPEGLACRRYIEQRQKEGKPRPNSTELAEKFKINRNTAAQLTTRVYGNAFNRDGANAAREYLTQLDERPAVKYLIKEYKIGAATACRILAERFGPAPRYMTPSQESLF